MNRKINISESEKKRIRKLYEIEKVSDYVFDFVLTENHKYLIIMDNVFVAGGDGNSIGSIWDNTHIFNELIKENFTKLGLITENTDNKLIENFVWEKELVRNALNSKEQITEGLWDDIKSKSGEALKSMGQSANAASFMLKQGLIPFLQWVRRGLYTGVGIVIDVVVSILAAKSNAIVWLVIVLLDVYELITGQFDPNDPDRKEMPYWSLGCDLLGAILTSAYAFPLKKMGASVAKYGRKALSKNALESLTILYKKIPTLSSSIKSVGNLFVFKMPSSKQIITVILNGVDKVLKGFQTFLSKLLSKEGLKAGAMGGATLGVVKATEYGINKIAGDENPDTLNTISPYTLLQPDPNKKYNPEDYIIR